MGNCRERGKQGDGDDRSRRQPSDAAHAMAAGAAVAKELEHVGHLRHTGGPWQLVAPHLADAFVVITLARSVERDGDLLRHTDRAREEHRRFTVRSRVADEDVGVAKPRQPARAIEQRSVGREPSRRVLESVEGAHEIGEGHRLALCGPITSTRRYCPSRSLVGQSPTYRRATIMARRSVRRGRPYLLRTAPPHPGAGSSSVPRWR